MSALLRCTVTVIARFGIGCVVEIIERIAPSVGGERTRSPLPRPLACAVCDAATCSVGLGFPTWGCRSHYGGCRLPLLSVGLRLLRGLQGHRPHRWTFAPVGQVSFTMRLALRARPGRAWVFSSLPVPQNRARQKIHNGLLIIAAAIITIMDCTVIVRGVTGWLPRTSVRFTP